MEKNDLINEAKQNLLPDDIINQICLNCLGPNKCGELSCWLKGQIDIYKRIKNMYEKRQKTRNKCKQCLKEFEDYRKGKKFCSENCRNKFHLWNIRVKRYKRKLNYILEQKIENKSCVFCKYNEILDIHHEKVADGRILIFYLCPNHHALITRGVKTFEQLLKEYNIVELPYKIEKHFF